MKTIIHEISKISLSFLFLFLFSNTSVYSQSPWSIASTGLPSSGSSEFLCFAESSNTLYIASPNGYIYYNNFTSGLTTTWTSIAMPSGFNSPLTNICVAGSYLYMFAGSNLFMYNLSTSTWYNIYSASPGAGAAPSANNYLQYYNQLLATDGTYLYFADLYAGSGLGGAYIYKTSIGSTSTISYSSYFYSTTDIVNCFYVYSNQSKMYIGTSTGLYSASTSATGSTWSDEFAGTAFEGYPVYQFINTNYSTSYSKGTGLKVCIPLSGGPIYTYYPFSVVINSCGTTCPEIVQLVESRKLSPYESTTGCLDCIAPNYCQYANWESTFAYTNNSWPSTLPTTMEFGSCVTNSGGVTAGTAATAKQWVLGYSGTTGAEKSTYVNSSAWTATGTEGISGLPAFSSSTVLSAAYGAHNTYDTYSGMLFLGIGTNPGKIYALESYTYDKDPVNNGVSSGFTGLDNSLKLFPNPANNMITFDLSVLNSGDFTLKVYDELGREIVIPATNSYVDMGVMKLDVDLSHFATGIYYYKLNSDKEYSGKFVKQ